MTSSSGPRVAVIGGGMAGLELAATLAAPGTARVEVIERGPARRRDHILWDRATYPGDEKTRRWVGDGWGLDGGLSERLGGRSLCYHGVLLGIDASSLAAWPASWVDRFEGPDGYYTTIPADLAPEFPELRPTALSSAAARLGLRHVPQAIEVVPGEKRLRAYTPLTTVTDLVRTRALTVVRAAAVRVEARGDRSWTIAVVGPDGTAGERGPFDACVLAASAIGNVQLLSRSLSRRLTTNLTDHLCIGGLVRLPPGPPLNDYRHRKLWSGYVPVPELDANIFVREFEPLPNGDRLVDIHAVVEQDCSDQGSSSLLVTPRWESEATDTRITPVLSERDGTKLAAVRRRIHDLAGSLGEDVVGGGSDRRSGWDDALAVIDRQQANSMAYYDLPYGEYEHESSTHPIGGTALGISEDLEVLELPGVYVAGPGAFPRMGAANPALTILAMSRSLATILRTRYGC